MREERERTRERWRLLLTILFLGAEKDEGSVCVCLFTVHFYFLDTKVQLSAPLLLRPFNFFLVLGGYNVVFS